MNGSLFSQFVGSIVKTNFATVTGRRALVGLRHFSSWNGFWRPNLRLSAPVTNCNKLALARTDTEFDGKHMLTPDDGNINSIRFISTSSALFAEPLKKKKKMDPAVVRAREERRKKKLERQIRKLEKVSRQFKPLDENEIPMQIINEPGKRDRRLPAISTEDANERWRLQKEWSRFKCEQNSQNTKLFARIIESQEHAMAQLRYESEELYLAACEPDASLLPFKVQGLVDTPPIENYQTPQGDYVDVSKKWDEKIL